jgi:hypothetical protein
MATKIYLANGRELTIALDGKRVLDVLAAAAKESPATLARFKSAAGARTWVNPAHVAAIEDRPDLD